MPTVSLGIVVWMVYLINATVDDFLVKEKENNR
jgi:hypothetical protein